MFFRRPSPEPLWRDEFPIEAAEERYVTRRQFAKFLTLTSLGLFVGNLWILAKSWLRPGATEMPAVAVAGVSEIPVGGVKLFGYPTPEDPCLLVRLAPDRYVAYSQKCTHLSCAVYYAGESGRLECPCHHGSFAVEDGHVLAGPPPRPLPRVVLGRQGDQLVATAIEVRRS
jgi:Rieske Fe-S protein